MPAHQKFQSASDLAPRYVKKNDGDGDMLYLEHMLMGEALVLCGTNTEIFQLLENAISHIPMGDQEPPMRYIQELIVKAHDKGILRYAPPALVWDDQPANRQRQFELRRSAMSGVEFGYILSTDEITWAIQSIDGVELEPSEFLQELQRAVGVEEQPCQQYAQKRAIVDEEPEVTEHNDEPERTWVVTQVTAVRAADKYQAIDRVSEMHSSSELISQEAEPHLEKFRIGVVHEVWAEDEKHAVEQFYDIVDKGANEIVNIIEEVPS